MAAPSTHELSPQRDRAAGLAPWIGGALVALPVLLVAYPPMADLPLHEASVGLLRHWGDPVFCPPSVYFLNLGHANQLFSLLVFAMSWLVPIAWASKIVVALTLLALPVAAARFADHVAAPRWTALLVAPLGLGWLFFWGLIQNLLGLVFLMALLPNIDRFAARPSPRRAAAMCGWMALLALAHQAMQLVACGALVLCSVGLPSRLKAHALRGVPIAFSGALVYLDMRSSWRLAGPRHKGSLPYEWTDTWYKIKVSPSVLFAGYEPYVRNLLFLLALTPLALLVAHRVENRHRGPRPLGDRVRAQRFTLVAAALFLLYLVAPSTMHATTLVYHRFLPPAWAIIAVAGASGTAATARLLPRALCALAPVASLLVGWPVFVDADRIYTDFNTLMPMIDKGSAVMALNFGPDPPTRLWGPTSVMGRVVSERGGRSLFDYTQSPVSPVSMRSKKQWAESITRMEKLPLNLTPAWDFTRYRYLFAATPAPSLAFALTLALRNDAVLVAAKGDWYLFESRLPLAPVTAGDAWPPKPHPATLQYNLQLVSRELELIEQAGLAIP